MGKRLSDWGWGVTALVAWWSFWQTDLGNAILAFLLDEPGPDEPPAIFIVIVLLVLAAIPVGFGVLLWKIGRGFIRRWRGKRTAFREWNEVAWEDYYPAILRNQRWSSRKAKRNT